MSDDLADLIIEYALPMGEEAAHDAAVAIRAAGYLSPADVARIKAEAAAEALLEAADWIENDPGKTSGVGVADWLRTRAARAAAVTGGEQGSVQLTLSPDCRDGNHHKCNGIAWDEELDTGTACECDCQCNGKAARSMT